MPAAFAAIVRKLMSKKPDERYQNCAELRADLLAGPTRPACTRSWAPRPTPPASFRPPPPELVEDDLRLLAGDDSASRDGVSLRDLGAAEPSNAPRHQQPLPPLTAVVRPGPSREAAAMARRELVPRLELARPVRNHRRRRRPARDPLHRHLPATLDRSKVPRAITELRAQDLLSHGSPP